MTIITPSHADEYERLVIGPPVWRGIRNAIVPSLIAWCALGGLTYLGFRLGEAALVWAGASQ